MNETRLNPFPGLRPFGAEEDFLFFGREQQTNELLELLREHRFLAVVGTSGSGKSSLVRAGLLPALYGGTMVTVGSRWEVAVMRPGGNPIRNLAQALVDCDLYDAKDEESLPRLLATLRRSRNGLFEAIRQSDLNEGHNLLLVVDQFEELFRFRADSVEHQEVASEFAQLLLSAAAAKDISIYVTLTMRSDYLGECAQISGLAEAVNDGEYLIPRLTRDQRRDAIAKPIAVGGGKISGRLSNLLLNEVGDDVDQLPVLQHALMRIWDEWEQDRNDNEPIDIRHYEAVGGLSHALSQHADEVYQALASDELKMLCERIFKALTERGPDARGIRRPTSLSQLCKIVEGSESEVLLVLDAFRKVGRTFVMPPEEIAIEPNTVVDISHESLMRVWQRLRTWVDEESQSARVYRRLAETAALFADNRAGHYRDPDLSIATAWREQNRPNESWADRYAPGFDKAIGFLGESQDAANAEELERELQRQRELEQAKQLAHAQQTARRRSQAFTVCVGIAAVVICFFWVKARNNERLAKANALKAEANATQAILNENLAKEQKERAEQQTEIAETEAQRNRIGLYAASIKQAQQELFINKSPEAAALQLDQWVDALGIDGTIDSHPIRDWEWYYLKSLANAAKADPRIETFKLGSSSIQAGRWSPDGKLLAVTGSGNKILILDASSKEVVQSFNRSTLGFCWRMAWSPDSKYLAAYTWSNPIEIYDVSAGRLIRNLGDRTFFFALSWNPRQDLIAFGFDNSTKLGIYDLNRQQLVNVIQAPTFIHTVEWSPDGNQLAYSTAQGGLCVVDYPSLTVSYELENDLSNDAPGTVNNIGFSLSFRWSSDGKKLVGRQHKRQELFVATLAEKRYAQFLDLKGKSIWQIALHPSKPWLAVSDLLGEIHIVDFEEKTLIESLTGIPNGKFNVDWHPAGDRLFASVLNRDEAMLIDFAKNKSEFAATQAEPIWSKVKLTRDGQQVSVPSSEPGQILTADLDSQSITSKIDTPLENKVTNFAWTKDGSYLAVAGIETLLVVGANSPDYPTTQIKLENNGAVKHLAWSADGKYLAFLQYAGWQPFASKWGVFRFEEGSLKPLQLDAIDTLPTVLRWHPTKALLAVGLAESGRQDSPVELWDISEQVLKFAIPADEETVADLAYSHSGEHIAVAFDREADQIFSGIEKQGAIRIFRTGTRQELGQFPILSRGLNNIQWGPTDQRIATASKDGSVRIWRTDGTELLALNPFDSVPVESAFWDRSGKRLIASATANYAPKAYSIENSLDDAALDGSPVLLGKLASDNAIDKENIASLYAASGKFRDAAALLNTIQAGRYHSRVFPTRYWRLRKLPVEIGKLFNPAFEETNVAELEAGISKYLSPTYWQELKDFRASWAYVGLESTGLKFGEVNQSGAGGLQVIATRYYSYEEMPAAFVVGGAGKLFMWHNGQLVIEHDRPSSLNNGEVGSIIDLRQGWNDFLFVINSATGELSLDPTLLDNIDDIVSNSAITWDGITTDQFTQVVNHTDLPEVVKKTLEYELNLQAGQIETASEVQHTLNHEPGKADYSHAEALRQAGHFQEATEYARRHYEATKSNSSAFFYGACLASQDAVSLVDSTATWKSAVGNDVQLRVGIRDLLGNNELCSQHLFQREWSKGGLIRPLGTAPEARSYSDGPADKVLLLRSSFNTETPIKGLLFEIEVVGGLVVYVDGTEIFRSHVEGVDRLGVRAEPDASVGRLWNGHSRRQIALAGKLEAGEHELAISIHQNPNKALFVRCPTLSGFVEKKENDLPELPAAVELGYHLAYGATRGHFDWRRVNMLIEEGLNPLQLELYTRSICAMCQMNRTFTKNEKKILSKILLNSYPPANPSFLAYAIQPAILDGDPIAVYRYLETLKKGDHADGRFLSARLLESFSKGSEDYHSTRENILENVPLKAVYKGQTLLVVALSLTKLTEDQGDLISQYCSQIKANTDGPAMVLLGHQTAGDASANLEQLADRELSEDINAFQRYLASVVLSRCVDAPEAGEVHDRRSLQKKLHKEILAAIEGDPDTPVLLTDWLVFQVAEALLVNGAEAASDATSNEESSSEESISPELTPAD